MKQVFSIKDTLENKISYYHIAAFLLALPFDRFYSELILISFILHTLIHINKQKLRSILTTQTLLPASVFLTGTIGLLYSQDKAQGITDLQIQSAIILFPLSIAASGPDWKKYKMNFLLVFSFTCVFTILYLYIDAIRIILFNNLPLSFLFSQSFINHNFSSPIDIHATYLGMYCLLSLAIFLYSFLKATNNNRRIIYFLPILVLLAGLIQLASRSVLISAMVIAPCFPFLMLKGAKRINLVAAMVVAAVFVVLVILNITSFKMRYVAELKEDLAQTSINNEVLEPRIVRWQYILKLIEKSPVFGYGSGSEKRLLKETYFDNKLYNSYLHELNAHNQYLSITLKTGVWGLLIFLFTLLAGFAAALRNRDIIFGSFLIIICVVSFSENLLDTNKGIFFYSFFFSLFIQCGKPFDRLFRFKEGRSQ
jgi:O-antigen ligase